MKIVIPFFKFVAEKLRVLKFENNHARGVKFNTDLETYKKCLSDKMTSEESNSVC